MNHLFDGLTYNTSRHFAHARIFPFPFGARKNTTQLAKYLCILYAKPSNKVYIFCAFLWPNNGKMAQCVVPENIHTPTTEGIGNSRGVGGSKAQEIPERRGGC